ncbi:MAG TPA: HD domain-containing phosphohydrolase, partial [Thermoleophilaceae bacterium]|nr:HD domain-containing phosphohydrolase [Thermoleophilaceae bacterium]
VVLHKAGPLDGVERDEVQMHCELGARLLSRAGLEDIASWVLAHHERPDGLGYPGRLTTAEIPLEARILAVADAYAAMVADRVYQAGIGPDEARAELAAGAGTQFDEVVVEAFTRVLDRSELAMQPA